MEEKRGDSKEPKMEVTGNSKKYEIKAAGDSIEPSPVIHNDKPEPRLAMVPFLSWRTIIIIVIGAVVGLVLGIGYYIISPPFSSSNGDTSNQGGSGIGFLQALFPESTDTVPWTNKVYLQLVNPGSSYISLTDLNSRAQYYATKANSLPFYKFLSEELTKQAPEYAHTPSELEQMLRVRISNPLVSRSVTNYVDINAPAIELKVTGTSVKETLFLAGFVPQAFDNYLNAEENDKKKQEYQKTLDEIESVKAALYEAQQELNALQSTIIIDNPEYVLLKTKMDALQRTLDSQTVQLTTTTTSSDDIQQEYNETIKKIKSVSADVKATEEEMIAMGGLSANIDNSSEPNYIMLSAKVASLEIVVNQLMTGSVTGGTVTIGLAEMITNGDTSSPEYLSTLAKVEVAISALSEAKKELTALNRSDKITNKLEYQIAQIKLDTLNSELSSLWNKLSTLTRESINGDGQGNTQQAFSKIAAALVQTKNELAALEKKLGYDRMSAELDKKVTQDKVSNLNTTLENLTLQLSSLAGDNGNSAQINYLTAGEPSVPVPVLPQRAGTKTLLIFILVGIVGGWALLNFKWIAKGMPSSSMTKQDEDEK